VLTMTFLSLVKAVSATGAFLVYSGMCVITFVIVWRFVRRQRAHPRGNRALVDAALNPALKFLHPPPMWRRMEDPETSS